MINCMPKRVWCARVCVSVCLCVCGRACACTCPAVDDKCALAGRLTSDNGMGPGCLLKSVLQVD